MIRCITCRYTYISYSYFSDLEPEAPVTVPDVVTVVAATSPFAPYTTAEPDLTIPDSEPLNKLNSDVVEVTPSNLLSSSALAVTVSLPNINEVVFIEPSTVT